MVVVVQDALEIVGACMEIMNETIAKFGGLMRGEHSKLRDALVPALEEPRAGIRKRAIHGLGMCKSCFYIVGSWGLLLEMDESGRAPVTSSTESKIAGYATAERNGLCPLGDDKPISVCLVASPA